MDKIKFLVVGLFWVFVIMLPNGPAFAERECTHQVASSGGTKDIAIDCTSSYTETSNSFWNNPFFYIQNQMAKIFAAEDHSKQLASDMKEKEQETIDTQRTKEQDQEIQAENLKDRQEMQQEQQQDLMQEHNDKM